MKGEDTFFLRSSSLNHIFLYLQQKKASILAGRCLILYALAHAQFPFFFISSQWLLSYFQPLQRSYSNIYYVTKLNLDLFDFELYFLLSYSITKTFTTNINIYITPTKCLDQFKLRIANFYNFFSIKKEHFHSSFHAYFMLGQFK